MAVGVLVVAQYPLYSALTTLFDGELVGYYLDEDLAAGWVMTETELQVRRHAHVL